MMMWHLGGDALSPIPLHHLRFAHSDLCLFMAAWVNTWIMSYEYSNILKYLNEWPCDKGTN